MADTPFNRCGKHDPADLNEVAGLIQDGFGAITSTQRRHILLDERYGTAVLILESDWLREKLKAAGEAGYEQGKEVGRLLADQPLRQLVSSFAINPAIPYEFRVMLRQQLGEPPLAPEPTQPQRRWFR